VESYFALGDDPTCPILPAPELDASGRERVQEVIDFFGLNLDPTVRGKRSLAYEAAIRAVQEGRWSDVQEMAMRHREHSFAARFALARVAPNRLPTEQDELLDLVRMLWRDFTIQLAELRQLKARGKSPRSLDKRQMRSYCWALIVLQEEPDLQNLLTMLFSQETAESAKEIAKAFRTESRLQSRIANRK